MLTKQELNALGYEINPDSDQPGLYYWRFDQDASDISYSPESRAIEAASQDALGRFELHRCDNCSKVHSDETLDEAKDVSMRVDPGCPYPSGECPDCGALCYPLKEDKSTPGNTNSTPFFAALVNDLTDGVSADIWYDASDYDDTSAKARIERTQGAMNQATEFLQPFMTAERDWESVDECVQWILVQKEPQAALAAVLHINIMRDEMGFTQDVLRAYQNQPG